MNEYKGVSEIPKIPVGVFWMKDSYEEVSPYVDVFLA